MHFTCIPNLRKLALASLLLTLFFQVQAQETAIPTAGNTYRSNSKDEEGRFNGNIVNWKNTQATTFTTYFRTQSKGAINIAIHAKSNGSGKMIIGLVKKSKQLNLSNTNWQKINVGSWNLKDTGYQALTLALTGKDLSVDIDTVYISGPATKGELVFVPNNEGNFYYWGRRGPSVHLGYQLPKGKDVEWFYNEITVPVGGDPIGSYFMADGFSVGYFGFQVNAADRRHVLFSVWSPFTTDNPKDIPADKKITLLKKGENVHGGEFGGEGSGGQSYLNYLWKAGTTYRFLLHAHPNADSTTDFTAYFYAPEVGKWQLIASFRRPHTYTWLKGLHSFLENFSPDMGDVSRMAHYGNQWLYTTDGEWVPANKARFTIDNTGRKNYRKDYAGGASGNTFFLKNGGYFSSFTKADSQLTRSDVGDKQPDIDFSALP
ncbi:MULTISPECIES: DUF3472 domain-containing protein [Chitinophagaceae]